MASEEDDINFTVSVPGKVILFGEHSVVYKRSALSTSISKRLFVNIKSSLKNTVSVNLPQINTHFDWSFEKFKKVVSEKCPMEDFNEEFSLHNPEMIDHNKYIESLKASLNHLETTADLPVETNKATLSLLGLLFVIRGMFQSFASHLVPFSLEVKSDIEVGAGTGSSAAFAVAISCAIYHLRKKLGFAASFDIKQSLQIINDCVIVKSHNENSGFTIEELKVCNKWAFCVEKIMHGRPSGIDNTTCSFGSVVVTSNLKANEGLIFKVLEYIPKVKFLLISTGVSRNTASLVARVRNLRDNNCAAVDAIFNAMDVIAQEAFKTLEALGRVDVCETATDNMNLYKTLGVLIDLNHGLLRTLGVSHESLEHIVKKSNSHGLSCKLTGAGGGGYAITLVPQGFSRDQTEALKRDLEPEFTVTEVNIAEDGVRLENL